MVNNVWEKLDLSNYIDLKEMHQHVSIIIEGSKSKINNTFGPHIEVSEREWLLLWQWYMKSLTIDELRSNYVDCLDHLIRQNMFSSWELLILFNKILINLIKKESKK
jgi:hypothetical protein